VFTFSWCTMSLRVGDRAARRSCLPSGGGGRQAGTAVLLLLVWQCEFTTGQVRSASECVRRSHCAARHTPTQSVLVWLSGRLSSHRRHTRYDKTVLSVSFLVCRCELDDCSERVQTSNFLSATVLSCRESSSHRQSGHDTDKTVLSCLEWWSELAFTFLTCPSICACMHAEAFSDPLAAEFSR